MDGFVIVTGPGFCHDVGEMVPDGSFAEEDPVGDLGDAGVVFGRVADFDFAGREGVIAGAAGGFDQVVVENAKSVVYAADGGGKLIGWGVFDNVTADAGVNCALEISGAVEGGDDNDGAVGTLQDLSSFNSANIGHFDVEKCDVNAVFFHSVGHSYTTAEFGDDFDVGFEVEEYFQGASYEVLVVSD